MLNDARSTKFILAGLFCMYVGVPWLLLHYYVHVKNLVCFCVTSSYLISVQSLFHH